MIGSSKSSVVYLCKVHVTTLVRSVSVIDRTVQLMQEKPSIKDVNVA